MATASDAKVCLCQLCTCEEKMHKCVYGPDDEALKKASVAHCRSCGGCNKRRQPYVPAAPMETTSSYSDTFRPLNAAAPRPVRPAVVYNRPAAAMETDTTYNQDFTNKKMEDCRQVRKDSGYLKPMGDMQLESTYSEQFRVKQGQERCVSFKPATYNRPMAPMDFHTTYTENFTEKKPLDNFVPCCPCCDPKSQGYVRTGEENGHVMFVKKTK